MTSSSLEDCPQQTNINLDTESIMKLIKDPSEKEEVVIWVWNNIMTRDKMRRTSVAGCSAPVALYEKQKR